MTRLLLPCILQIYFNNLSHMTVNVLKSDMSRCLFFSFNLLLYSFFRLSAVVSTALLEQEETQIAGTATIIDHEGMTMRQTSMFSVTDIIDFADCIKSSVGRHKKLYVVNLPPFALFLLEAARSRLNDKLKKRITIARDMDDLKNHFDPLLLPKIYGGKYSEEEHKEYFEKYFKGVRPKLEEIKARVIDWNKVPGLKKSSESVGSFRKLEID